MRQLQEGVHRYCLRRLERYVVPVSWKDDVDAETDDLSRLLTDPGRARVSAAVASLVDNEILNYFSIARSLLACLMNGRANLNRRL